jgi:hypothetical protein
MHCGVSAERLGAAQQRVERVRNSVALLNSLPHAMRINPSGAGSCEMAFPNLWALGSATEARGCSPEQGWGEFVHWLQALPRSLAADGTQRSCAT